MSMMSGLSDLEGTALAKVLRRTIVSALIGGGGAIVVALLLSAPWAALGIVIGLAMAIVNLRFLDAGVAKVQTKGETSKKASRRAMGTKSVTRLGRDHRDRHRADVPQRRPRHRRGDRAWSSSSCSSCSTWAGCVMSQGIQ